MSILRIDQLDYHAASDDKGEGFRLSVDQFTMFAGDKVAIVGPSGAGKTTLLNLIAGTIKAQSGDIKLLGKSTQNLSASELDSVRGRHLGVVFQSLNLLPFASAQHNVTVAGSFSAERRKRGRGTEQSLLKALGLDLNTLASRRPVQQMSVGQQQRIAAARALYGAPDLILADEPTSALDAENRDRFLALLLDALDASRQAILVVTHDMALARRFDRVISMEALTSGQSQ